MITIGSQSRELIESTTARVVGTMGKDEILVEEDGEIKVYRANNHYAGYVLVVNGIGYEFIGTATNACLEAAEPVDHSVFCHLA